MREKQGQGIQKQEKDFLKTGSVHKTHLSKGLKAGFAAPSK